MIEQWQIDQFHQDGFLVVEDVLAAPEWQRCSMTSINGCRTAAARLRPGVKPWMVAHASMWKAITVPTIPRCAG